MIFLMLTGIVWAVSARPARWLAAQLQRRFTRV
jgi:hypothetical protein